MALKEAVYEQREPYVIIIHEQDPDKPWLTMCTGQPFALYSVDTLRRKRTQKCRKCTTDKIRETQGTLF